MAHTLVIRTLHRELADGGLERLEFDSGVNLIVGAPNTGKTVWLRMLDYLLGDNGGPETALATELVEKYVAVGAEAEINGDLVVFERRWDRGPKTKTLLDGVALSREEFSAALLERLGVPAVNYPKGDPYSERGWPSLSWRELLRHIYRQERLWSGIAPKQPDGTVHASIILFLGLADRVFSPLLGDLVAKRKELYKMRARKDHFQEMVDEVARDLMPEQVRDEALTALTLSGRTESLEQDIAELLQVRESVLDGAASSVGESTLSRLALERGELLDDLERVQTAKSALARRLEDVYRLASAVRREINQLVNVEVAGTAFADLKVTHCPACDQKLLDQPLTSDECFLCHQELSPEGAHDRIAYEHDQLEQEGKELDELSRKLQDQIDDQSRLEQRAKERLDLVVRDLAPARAATSAVVSEEVSRIDAERGRLEEQVRQMGRFESVLNLRDRLNETIDRLESEVKTLAAEQGQLDAEVSFENASAFMEDSMNHFTNLLNQGIERYGVSDTFRWTHGTISLDLSERNYRFRVKGQSWSTRLGATVQVHFLLAYHYALLRLTMEQGRHYPGLVILDFPPNLLDSETVGDKENYLIDPFIDLCASSDTPMQVIVAGRAFEGLEANVAASLKHVWA